MDQPELGARARTRPDRNAPAFAGCGRKLFAHQAHADLRLDQIDDHRLVVCLDKSCRQRRTIVKKLHDQRSMRAVLRRNDPRPFGDDLPRRAHELVGPGDGDRDPVDNFTQCDRIEVGFGSVPEVETRVERAVAYADQRVAGQHLMQLELELGMALEGESKQFAHLQYGWVQHRADLDGAGG